MSCSNTSPSIDALGRSVDEKPRGRRAAGAARRAPRDDAAKERGRRRLARVRRVEEARRAVRARASWSPAPSIAAVRAREMRKGNSGPRARIGTCWGERAVGGGGGRGGRARVWRVRFLRKMNSLVMSIPSTSGGVIRRGELAARRSLAPWPPASDASPEQPLLAAGDIAAASSRRRARLAASSYTALPLPRAVPGTNGEADERLHHRSARCRLGAGAARRRSASRRRRQEGGAIGFGLSVELVAGGATSCVFVDGTPFRRPDAPLPRRRPRLRPRSSVLGWRPASDWRSSPRNAVGDRRRARGSSELDRPDGPVHRGARDSPAGDARRRHDGGARTRPFFFAGAGVARGAPRPSATLTARRSRRTTSGASLPPAEAGERSRRRR